MKVRMSGYIRVHMTTDVDTTDEDEAYTEASGKLYNSLLVLLDTEDATIDWEFDDYGLDMEIEEDAGNNESCENAN